MDKDFKMFLKHILESINYIGGYIDGVSEEQFISSIQLQDSIIRRLQVIGEATKNLPDSFKIQNPHIPWRKISGMRDNLVHEYFGVDKAVVWETIIKDLPKFKKDIIKLLK